MAEKCSCIGCSVKLQELEERLRKLEIEKDTAMEEKESVVAENKELEDKVRNLEKKIVSLRKEVTEQQRHIEQYHQKTNNMTQEIKSLKDEVADLKGELAYLKKGSATLYVAQAASLFQQSICCALLPETFKGNKFATIKQLVKYLKRQEELPEEVSDDLGAAKNKWEDIRKKLGWTEWDDNKWDYRSLPSDLKAIIALKTGRVDTAHPPTITLKEAMQYVPLIEVTEFDRKHIRSFLGSMEKKMKSCGLYNKSIEELRHSDSSEDIQQIENDSL